MNSDRPETMITKQCFRPEYPDVLTRAVWLKETSGTPVEDMCRDIGIQLDSCRSAFGKIDWHALKTRSSSISAQGCNDPVRMEQLMMEVRNEYRRVVYPLRLELGKLIQLLNTIIDRLKQLRSRGDALVRHVERVGATAVYFMKEVKAGERLLSAR